MKIVEYYIKNFPLRVNSCYAERYFSKIKQFPNEWADLQLLDYFDDEQIIREWKLCLYPSGESFVCKIEQQNAKYYYLSYFLWREGYYVKEFPLELESTRGLSYFSGILFEATAGKYGKDNGVVRWKDRRALIDGLNVIKKDEIITVEEKVDDLIKMISTRSAKFEHMSIDEKLENIKNAYENLINRFGGFEKIDYNKIFMGFIEEDNLTIYSKKLQAFRHAHANALAERVVYAEQEKKYIIEFGVIVLNRLWNILNGQDNDESKF